MALTVVTSVINGFEGELARVITGTHGEVLLYSRGDPIQDQEAVETEIQKLVPETQAITASFIAEVMAVGASGTSGSVLQGIELDRIGKVTSIPQRVIQGRLPQGEAEVVVGSALAEKLGASVGHQIRLIVPFTENLDSAPKAIEVRIVGIIRMGMYDYDSKFIYMTLPAVQSFLNQHHRVTNFNIKLTRGADPRQVSDRLSEVFSFPFRAKDWSQLNKNLFYAIRLEKVVIGIILTVIVVVAVFNVVSTLMMMIHDKSKEIAILKTMGFLPSQSFKLFCFIGLGIGIVGTAFGLAAGLGLGWILERTEWIRLPADIYYIGFLPVVIRWIEVGLIALVALLIAFLATLYPSWAVSRRAPLEGIRYD